MILLFSIVYYMDSLVHVHLEVWNQYILILYHNKLLFPIRGSCYKPPEPDPIILPCMLYPINNNNAKLKSPKSRKSSMNRTGGISEDARQGFQVSLATFYPCRFTYH